MNLDREAWNESIDKKIEELLGGVSLHEANEETQDRARMLLRRKCKAGDYQQYKPGPFTARGPDGQRFLATFVLEDGLVHLHNVETNATIRLAGDEVKKWSFRCEPELLSEDRVIVYVRDDKLGYPKTGFATY